MGKKLNADNRNYLWDNIKAFLIFTVVLGHFLEFFPVNNIIFKILDYWIYTFHMPAFLFVSGFWAKNYCRDGKVRAEKVVTNLAYFLVFQVAFFLFTKLFLVPTDTFTLFYPDMGLWYLCAVVAYYLLIPVAEKVPFYITLPCCFILSLLINTDPAGSSFMVISRIFVFLPYFFLGYYLTQDTVNTIRKTKGKVLVGIISVIVSVGIWGSIIYFKSRDAFPLRMFYGKSSYESMGFSDKHGMALRVLTWIISLLMIFALIVIFSEKKNIFSYLGKYSLQIYILHMPFGMIFRETDFTQQFPVDTWWQGIVICLLAVALTLVLSIPVFSKPFTLIQKGVQKILTMQKGKNQI